MLTETAEAEVVPIAYSLTDVPRVTGRSKATIYRAIRDKKITALKDGRSTLIERTELVRWLSTLPTIGRRPGEAVAA